MIFYILYRMGRFIALTLPLKASYWIACMIADACYVISKKDRSAMIANLKIVLGEKTDEKELKTKARGAFRNFAKYLVDFFRFSIIDDDYLKKLVKVEGLDNITKALSKGKGAVMLSAHIGNWELGAFVLAKMGYPMSAVVLTHSHKKVNDFFTEQRMISNLKPIEIGISLRSCYRALKSNQIVALLGDRDFSKSGVYVDFFGKQTLIPKGPSVLSARMGSAIVPVFITRERDDSFRLVLEEPIYPPPDLEETEAIGMIIKKYLAIMESYIRKYPTQWYVFKEVWNHHNKFLQPDTII